MVEAGAEGEEAPRLCSVVGEEALEVVRAARGIAVGEAVPARCSALGL